MTLEELEWHVRTLEQRVEELETRIQEMRPPIVFGPFPRKEPVSPFTQEMPCLFDVDNPYTDPVMGLACPCPRCSPRA
jgi:hypothetical protein